MQIPNNNTTAISTVVACFTINILLGERRGEAGDDFWVFLALNIQKVTEKFDNATIRIIYWEVFGYRFYDCRLL